LLILALRQFVIKVENKAQYQAYLDETKALREELGIPTKEELYGSSI